MPEESKKSQPPDFEELKRQLGPEKMSFLSEMLRPDAEDEREEDTDLPTGTPSNQDSSQDLTPKEERELIKNIEARLGRKLTQQEINLALDQARSI